MKKNQLSFLKEKLRDLEIDEEFQDEIIQSVKENSNENDG